MDKKYLNEDGLAQVAGYVNTRLKTVTTMPLSADEGAVRLYVGEDTETYSKGHTYQYQSGEWVDITPIQPTAEDPEAREIATGAVALAKSVEERTEVIEQDLADLDSSDVPYDNTASGLSSTNVQDAIDELDSDIQNIPVITVDQTYDDTSTNPQSGTAVAEAIQAIPSITVDQTYDDDSTNPQSGTAVAEAVSGKIDSTEKGASNGVATLDGNGRVPYSQLPESAMEFKGQWDASTNTPHLVDGTGTNGDFYVVSIAGTVNFGTVAEPREVTFSVNDRVLYDSSIDEWIKLPAGEVSSVNGMSGAVTLTATNINYSSNTTVKDAIDDKANASALSDYVQKSQTAGLLKNDGTVDTNTYITSSSLSNYVQKSQTAGLLKNDGTVDTNTYLTSTSLSNYVQKSQTVGLLKNDGTVDTNTYASSAAITSAINDLDVSSVGGSGKYISAISETNGKISATATSLATSITSGGTTAPTSGAVYNAIAALDVSSVGGSGKYISAISETDGKISATASNLATSVTSGSAAPVTSGAVYTTLQSYPTTVDVQALFDQYLFDHATPTSVVANPSMYGFTVFYDNLIVQTTTVETAYLSQLSSLTPPSISITTFYDNGTQRTENVTPHVITLDDVARLDFDERAAINDSWVNTKWGTGTYDYYTIKSGDIRAFIDGTDSTKKVFWCYNAPIESTAGSTKKTYVLRTKNTALENDEQYLSDYVGKFSSNKNYLIWLARSRSPTFSYWGKTTCSAITQYINDICSVYSDNLCVAVGYAGCIATAPYTSSSTWTVRTSGTSNQLNRIIHETLDTSGLYVAVGNSGTIVTSTNGTTWTVRSSGVSNHLNSVAFRSASGQQLFVAVGNSGAIVTSTNGTTWTARTSITNYQLSDVIYANGMFVAVGPNDIFTSTDGINWTKRTITGSTATGPGGTIAYSPDLRLFVCSNCISTNGTTWTATSGIGSPMYIPDKKLFIARNTTTLKISNDGINWVTISARVASDTGYFYSRMNYRERDSVLMCFPGSYATGYYYTYTLVNPLSNAYITTGQDSPVIIYYADGHKESTNLTIGSLPKEIVEALSQSDRIVGSQYWTSTEYSSTAQYYVNTDGTISSNTKTVGLGYIPGYYVSAS